MIGGADGVRGVGGVVGGADDGRGDPLPCTCSPRSGASPACFAQPWDCILEAGEVLFVPSGSPHAVQNLGPTIAVSANYIDATNLEVALKEVGPALLQVWGSCAAVFACVRLGLWVCGCVGVRGCA